MDLSSPESVKNFSDAFINKNKALHILINNAGIMATPALEIDARGFGKYNFPQIIFQLTCLLWPALCEAQGGGYSFIRAHRLSPIVFEDSFDMRPYDCWKAYGQSKTANILFTRELAKRGAKDAVQAFSVHLALFIPRSYPGIWTEQSYSRVAHWIVLERRLWT